MFYHTGEVGSTKGLNILATLCLNTCRRLGDVRTLDPSLRLGSTGDDASRLFGFPNPSIRSPASDLCVVKVLCGSTVRGSVAEADA